MTKTAEATSSPTAHAKSSGAFFDRTGQTAEPATPFFSQKGNIQTKLAIGKSDDPQEQEADRMADQIQAKLSIGAPDDPYETEADQMADKVVSQVSSGPAVQTKKIPTQRGREVEEGDHVYLKSNSLQRLGEDVDANGSTESVVAAARSMIGKIEAKHAEGGQRVGAKYLLEIFHLAAPGVWDDATITTAGAALPSWCGIFAVWAHKKAGKDIGNWQIGKGVSAFGTLSQTSSPQTGDIGYIDQPFQHHCIIAKVDGDTITSIDGNSGLFSEVKENSRPRTAYTGFFTAFGAGSSVQRKPAVQRKSDAAPSSAPSSVESSLSSSKGKGNPLPEKLQQSMGSAMGADFSDVRIHDDHAAADMSKALEAQAFTHGRDIYFNQGKYDPSGKEGRHLLAHELTHTVQQGASAQRKPAQRKPDPHTTNKIQKNGDPAATSDEINESEFNGYAPKEKKGSIKKSGNSFTIKAIFMPIKGYADKSLIDAGLPYKKPKESRESNPTNQSGVWRSEIIGLIKKSLEAALPDPSVKNEPLLVLELKSNPAVKIVGSFNEIAEEIKVPFWNKDGQSVIHQIEHRVDFQLIGNQPNVTDNIKNLLLLDRHTNNQYGKNVRNDIREHIQSILDHYRTKYKKMPTAPQAFADKDFEIIFDSFVYEKVAPLGLIVKEFLEEPANPFNPINKKNIDIRKFEVTKGHFILKTSADRAGYLLPYKGKSVVLGGFKVTTDGDEENHKLISLKLEPATGKKGSKTILEKDLTAFNFDPANEVQKPVQDVYVISNQAMAVKLKDLIGVKGLSPVMIKNADIESGFNLQVNGIVQHNVQFLKDNNIEVGFNISGAEVSVYASISKDNIKIFPKPFEITNSSLSLTAGTEGVVVDGDLGFEIKNLGKGNLGATAGTTGFAVSGDFEFASKKFEGSRIGFKYLKNKWEIDGNIKVPGPKLITGVKKADLAISYKAEKITAKGSAELDVPAIDSVKLDAEFNDNGSFSIKGSTELKKMPGIKSGGKVDVTVAKLEGAEEYSLGISGEVEPNLPKVPNVNAKLTVSYKDGLFKAEGKADFKTKGGMFSGDVTVGVTNGTVVDGELQAGEGGKDITYYGKGGLTFHPIESINAKINVKVNAKGEALFSAELDISEKPFKEVKPAPLELLNVSKDIPLFGVPFLTLNFHVGLDASLYASWDPLTIKIKGTITDKSYDDLIAGKLDGALTVGAETQATVGLKVGVSAGVTVTVGVLVGGGELKGSVSLEAVGKVSGQIDATWSGEKGLKLKKASANATIRLDLIPGLDGRAFVDLDLLISRTNLWERPYAIGKGKPVTLYQLGVTVPFEFDDKNELKPFDIKQIKFDPPLDKDTANKQGDKAVNPNGKEAPPETKEPSVESKIRSEVAKNMRNERQNKSVDMYAYASNLRTHMLQSTSPELTGFVLKAVEDELKSIEIEDFTNFRAEVLSSKESSASKLSKIDAFEKEHVTVSKEDLATLRNEVKSQNASGAVMTKPENPSQPGSVNRQAADGGDDPEKEKTNGQTTTDDFAVRMQKAETNGMPLAPEVMAEMGKKFGADFSQVRVHYDNTAIALASEVNAQAFTHENHIFFNAGKYEPASAEGKKLLAHELTHVLQQGHGEQIRRVAETDITGSYTGNYIFDPGHDGLDSGFFTRVQQFVKDGRLSDKEIRSLRKDAIERNGSVLHAELLLMAAMRNPVNVALMQAHRGGSLILSISNILEADKNYVVNFDRAKLPPGLENPTLRKALALMGWSGETVDQAIAAMDQSAEKRMRQLAGKEYNDQVDKIVIAAGFTNPVVPMPDVLTAMVNAAADSTPGDQILAAFVYIVARRSNHSTAPHIYSGRIKVDAIIPSVYQRLLGGSDAGYSYSTDEDTRKANTLYIPMTADIFDLDTRALIIHELTHAEDDMNRRTEQSVNSLDLESRAYTAQGRYMMDEIIAQSPAAGLITSAAQYVNAGAHHYWPLVMAAKEDQTKYEVVFKDICSAPPSSKNRTALGYDLSLSEMTIRARIRTALLAARAPDGTHLYAPGTTRLGGSSGNYFQ